MTHRERWNNVWQYKPVDHVPDEEFGYWDDTLRDWRAQGLPDHVTDNGVADRFFGFAPRAGVWTHQGLIPEFESKVLEEDDRHRIIVDGSGVKHLVNKDGASSIPRYLEFPVKDRATWEAFREHLNPDDPARQLPEDQWRQHVEHLNASEAPVILGTGSLFGWLRNWAGFEGIAMLCLDDPDLVEEMIEHLCTFIMKTIERAAREVTIDGMSFWEDMAFKNGPMISPKLFRQWMTPRYQRITDLVRRHSPHAIAFVDCDGNVMQLVEHWLAGGVNCMFPVEVAAGSDPHAMRRLWGKDVLLMGGVNKRSLAGTKADIDREVDGLLDLVAQGGFIPHVDHRVPPDVSYDNYRYYLKRKREAAGIPEPEEG